MENTNQTMTVYSRFAAELFCRSLLWAISLETLTTGPAWVKGWEAAKPATHGKGANKVAVIPVQGILTKDGPAHYGSSYDSIAAAAEQAGNDTNVKHVVLDVDSPGGEVTGLPETAAILAQLNTVKPVSAIVQGTSASAAYWLTSQAKHVTLTPSGEVGSVGVRMMHVDVSKMLDDVGYKVTELSAGKYKTEWSPFKPLTEDAVNDMQPRLDAVHTDFLNAVTAGRGSRVSTELANQRMGEGRMFSANDAMRHGLVDALQSPRAYFKGILPAQEEETTQSPFGFHRANLEMRRRRIG